MIAGLRITCALVFFGVFVVDEAAAMLLRLVLRIMIGQWLPFICSMVLIAIICIELVCTYYRDSRYICPHCYRVFQPSWKSFFFSGHTPKTRKLTCTHCGEKSWCAEISIENADAASAAAVR